MSASANYGKSKASSGGEQFQYGSNVWAPQAPFLQDIYGQAQGMAAQGPQGGAAQFGQAGDIYGAAAGGLAGMAAGTGGNPQMDAYARQAGAAFQNQVMPALRGQAAAAGQLGSSRAQLGQAAAAGLVQQNMQDYSQQLYNEERNRQLQAYQGMQGAGAGMMQLGLINQASPWYNLQQYAGLVGGPAMQDLGGRSYNQSQSRSENYGLSGGFW